MLLVSNTDFKLKIDNFSARVHSKLSKHLQVQNIVQRSKESPWTKNGGSVIHS